jgi:methylmalonyl-CoA/ethylmalonyl-CoA epimerase
MGPATDPDIRLHHVGFVVASIADCVQGFRGSASADWDEKIFHDALQKARVAFLQTPCRTDAMIELVEPTGEDSPVFQFLKRGGGLHHLCYEVENLDGHLIRMRRNGAVVVRRARPAVAFENRRIAWTLTREKLLLEFLERKTTS